MLPLRSAPHALAIALLLAACQTTHRLDASVDIGPDCQHQTPHITHDGSTLVFAMTSLTIDPTDNPDVPHTGFDIDGFASTDIDPMGCAHADFLSDLDPESNCSYVVNEQCWHTSPSCACRDSLDLTASCHGSVDNQLPTVAATIRTALDVDIRASVSGDIARGRLVVLARLTGIDAFDEDPEVHVQLLNAFTAPGTACSTPRSGDLYQVARTSLRAGGSTEADGAVNITGSIHGGRLRAVGSDTQSFAITFQMADAPFRFELRHPIIAADVGPDGGVRGNFGGWVAGDALVQEFSAALPQYGAIVRGVVGGLLDVSINGICDGSAMSPPRLGAMSFGMGFEMVPVAIDPVTPVVDAPAPGTCSAPVDGGVTVDP